MIEAKESMEPEVLALNIRRKLTKGDLNDLLPALKKHTDSFDNPHLFIGMENFQGWEDTNAFWKDLKLDAEHIGKFDRIALVGDKRWEAWLTRLTDALTGNEIRYFYPDAKGRAWNWIHKHR